MPAGRPLPPRFAALLGPFAGFELALGGLTFGLLFDVTPDAPLGLGGRWPRGEVFGD